MSDAREFASRIRNRYPEGLTGIVVVGGSRINYALEHKESAAPGRIHDMRDYGRDVEARMQAFLTTYFELGGQNIIMPLLSYQLFDKARGQEYAQVVARMALDLVGQAWREFYKANEIDPYFAGIDTLLHFPEREASFELASACQQFQAQWDYQEGHRKLIWEIAPIPLYSIWQTPGVLASVEQEQLNAQLRSAQSLEDLQSRLYRFYASALYGTELPQPHFYIANNRNGDLKLRAMLPIALSCGSPMRLFFTPYPTLMMTRESLAHVLEDLAFGTRLSSSGLDYEGQVTAEQLEAEYARALELAADPTSIAGLLRPVNRV